MSGCCLHSTFPLALPLGKLGWRSQKHLWGAQQLGKKSELKELPRGSSCEGNGEKTHPESVTCSFPGSLPGSQALTLPLVPAAGMNPYFISKLQGTSHMNNFCSDKTAGPREAADTSLKMSIFWLPFKNKNALKQQATPNSWGKLYYVKEDKLFVCAARKYY